MFNLILSAEQIPDGTKVTKPTGTKEYILLTEGIKVYSENKKKPIRIN